MSSRRPRAAPSVCQARSSERSLLRAAYVLGSPRLPLSLRGRRDHQRPQGNRRGSQPPILRLPSCATRSTLHVSRGLPSRGISTQGHQGSGHSAQWACVVAYIRPGAFPAETYARAWPVLPVRTSCESPVENSTGPLNVRFLGYGCGDPIAPPPEFSSSYPSRHHSTLREPILPETAPSGSDTFRSPSCDGDDRGPRTDRRDLASNDAQSPSGPFAHDAGAARYTASFPRRCTRRGAACRAASATCTSVHR